MINYDLARQRNLNAETIAKIETLQSHRDNLATEYKAGHIGPRLYKDAWTANEFALQKLWGFSEDYKFHRFWDMEGCKCPKMDNDDSYPTGYYVTIEDCPLHGWGERRIDIISTNGNTGEHYTA